MKKDNIKPEIIFLLLILLLITGCAHVPSQTSTGGAMQLVMTSTGYSWVAMRYNEVTGETWFQFPYYWRTIGEKESLPESNYIIRMVGFGGDYWAAIRMDTRSGRCWMVQDSYWVRIENEPSTSLAGGPFNLEMVSNGSVWEAIRYNENTGQSWLHFQDKWRTIEETEKPINSNYILRMVGENGWLAIRMDIHSGRCWMTEKKDGFFHWVDMEMDVKS